jgi:topoisomerase-4 subunit A
VVAEVKVVDEPDRVISEKGWVRTRQAMATRPHAGFKAGDSCTARSNAAPWTSCWCLAATAGSTVPVASLPGGRGDGQPVTTLIDLEPAARCLLCGQ